MAFQPVGAMCRDNVQLAFGPGASEVAVFWPFCMVFFIICPSLHIHRVIFSPL